jgi:hypothetical protein
MGFLEAFSRTRVIDAEKAILDGYLTVLFFEPERL